MEIGETRKILVVEPVEDPIPRRRPDEEPAGAEQEPAEPPCTVRRIRRALAAAERRPAASSVAST